MCREQFLLNTWSSADQLVVPPTCKQSSEVMTMRGHLDWHASSNGKKYLSASMKLFFDLIGGKVLEPDLLSPLGGLGKDNAHKSTVFTWSSLLAGDIIKRQHSQISLFELHSPWHPGMTNRAWKIEYKKWHVSQPFLTTVWNMKHAILCFQSKYMEWDLSFTRYWTLILYQCLILIEHPMW